MGQKFFIPYLFMKENNMFNQGTHYRVWGENNSKTVLLIHGLSSSSLTWRKLAKDLANIGYKVIAPDLKGHGKSNRSRNYSLENWSNDILNLGIKPDIMIGHSLGGLIAANIQPTMKSQKIVLIDPVYRLPEDKLLLGGVQTVLAYLLLRKTWVKPKPEYRLNRIDAFREEIINLKKWDYRTIKGLKPNKKLIIKCLLSNKTNVLLMRAKGSFILPTHVMKKTFNNNVSLQYFANAGHNIHQDAYEEFWGSIKTFITNTIENTHISETKILTQPVQLQPITL